MRVRQLEGELRSAEESIERLESEQSRLVADGEATRKQLEDAVRQLEVEKAKLVEDNRIHEASVAELREQLEQHSKVGSAFVSRKDCLKCFLYLTL